MQRIAILVATALVSSCHGTPPADAHEETAAAPRPSASTLAARRGSADAAAPLPAYLPDGCWSDVATDAGAGPLLGTIAKRCAPGMQPIAEQPLSRRLSAGKQAELPFKLDGAPSCVRAIAAGGPGVGDLELSLVDSAGHVYGTDALEAPFALVDSAGPVCLPAGRYRARLRLRRGEGRVAVDVYRAK